MYCVCDSELYRSAYKDFCHFSVVLYDKERENLESSFSFYNIYVIYPVLDNSIQKDYLQVVF